MSEQFCTYNMYNICFIQTDKKQVNISPSVFDLVEKISSIKLQPAGLTADVNTVSFKHMFGHVSALLSGV